MNPYGPMFSGIVDNAVMFAITVAIACVGTIYFPRNWFYGPVNPGSETYCTAFAYTLLSFIVMIASLQMIGIVGILLRVVSGLWFVWEMLYLLSVSMAFRHLPILAVIALAWSLFGWSRLHYSIQSLLVAILVAVGLAINVGLHFAIDRLFQWQWPV